MSDSNIVDTVPSNGLYLCKKCRNLSTNKERCIHCEGKGSQTTSNDFSPNFSIGEINEIITEGKLRVEIEDLESKLERAIEVATKDLIGSRLDKALHYIETGEEL
jgi:hypothetical protein